MFHEKISPREVNGIAIYIRNLWNMLKMKVLIKEKGCTVNKREDGRERQIGSLVKNYSRKALSEEVKVMIPSKVEKVIRMHENGFGDNRNSHRKCCKQREPRFKSFMIGNKDIILVIFDYLSQKTPLSHIANYGNLKRSRRSLDAKLEINVKEELSKSESQATHSLRGESDFSMHFIHDKKLDLEVSSESLEDNDVLVGIMQLNVLLEDGRQKQGNIRFMKDALIKDAFTPNSASERNGPTTAYGNTPKHKDIIYFFSTLSIKRTETDSLSKLSFLLDISNVLLGKYLTLADVVRVTRESRNMDKDILIAWHKQHIEGDCIGGVKRSAGRQSKLNKVLDKVQGQIDKRFYKETRERCEKKLIDKLRDYPSFSSEGKNVKVGNHELIALEHIYELIIRDSTDEYKLKEKCGFHIKWIDLTMHFRVNIRYCIFLHRIGKNWTMQGHPKSICNSSSLDRWSQKTKGSREVLHNNVGQRALNESVCPNACAIRALEYHLQAIGSKKEFELKREETVNLFEEW